MSAVKRCPACGETKARSEYNAHRRRGTQAYCQPCERAYKRARNAAKRATRRPALPAAPLLRLAADRARTSGEPTEAVFGATGVRALHRAAASGTVPFWTADRLAVALGLHPALVWPEFFFDAEPVGGAA